MKNPTQGIATWIAVLGAFHACAALAAGPSARQDDPDGAHRRHGHEHGAVTADKRRPAIELDREGRPQRRNFAAAKSSKSSKSSFASAASAATVCLPSELGALSGSELVNSVKSCDLDALSNFFGLAGTIAGDVFQEAKMVAVADALRDASASYQGDNETQILQLITYLRAGYYVQYNNSAAVGPYGGALRTAIRGALDAFFANANSTIASDANGEVLSEAVTLVDSSAENARYLEQMIGILNRFDETWLASASLRAVANAVFTVTFGGHQKADFKALVQRDQRIIDALYNFHNRWASLLGTGSGYLASNAAVEVARFLQHRGAVQGKVRGLARDLLARSSTKGATAAVNVGVAGMVQAYDDPNCSAYGTCSYTQALATDVLPITYTCSATLRIRAQEMTSTQLSNTCATQANQESRFHTMLATGRVPVAGDLNDELEMVVFNSSTDYQTYAGSMFGISTNNGGMYLEGNPASSSNQARFIAYEAEWLQPSFVIWNLEHEYVHYLDGRFDMKGDFNTYLTASTVWWIEGLAEYVAYVDNNPTAVNAVRNATHVPLSTIFRNTYSSGTDRIYRWGYFAARFMFEKHRSDVTTILGYYRNGSYSTYNSYVLSTLGTRYDTEFRSWMTALLGGGTTNQLPTANFSFTTSSLTASFTDTSTDSDGTIASRSWNFGDGTTSTATNPTKTYSAAGTYTVTLTVTDNGGASRSTSKSVTVSSGGTTIPECTSTTTYELGKNCSRSNRSASTGNYDYMYIYLPSGVSQLRITVSGGTGNANLYVSRTTWATTSNAQYSSINSGNNETLTITSPASGYLYISLHAASSFSGVKITTQY